MEYKLHNGSGGLCCKGRSRQDKKLNTYDWLDLRPMPNVASFSPET